jgi:hypothetical protein
MSPPPFSFFFLLYFGLMAGCWNSLLKSCKIQRKIDVSPAVLQHGSAKKIAVWAHANRDPNKQEVGLIFA